MAGGGWGSSRSEGVLTTIHGGRRREAPERLGQPNIGANPAAPTPIRVAGVHIRGIENHLAARLDLDRHFVFHHVALLFEDRHQSLPSCTLFDKQ